MVSFRETRETLLLTHDQQLINDEEFVLLFDLNTSKNPDYPHWNYDMFHLDNWTDEEYKTDQRFYKSDIYRLANVLNIPEQIKATNRSTSDTIEALCVFLKPLPYPSRHSDLLPRFGRYIPELSMMSILIQNHIYTNYSNVLHYFNQRWLSPAALQKHSTFVHERGAPLLLWVCRWYSSTTMQTWGTPKNLIQRSQTCPRNKISISCDP